MATEIKWTYNKDRTLRARKGAKGQVILQRSLELGFKSFDSGMCDSGRAGFCEICNAEKATALEWAERRLSKKGRKPVVEAAPAELGC